MAHPKEKGLKQCNWCERWLTPGHFSLKMWQKVGDFCDKCCTDFENNRDNQELDLKADAGDYNPEQED